MGEIPEIPYPGHAVLPTRVHEVTIIIEPQTGNILGKSLKDIHLNERCVQLVQIASRNMLEEV